LCHKKAHYKENKAGIAKVIEILELKEEGKTLREIGEIFGVSKQRVSQIISQAIKSAKK
jgi:DNA-directed RNA polymerase specialized sigma subunit